MSSLRKGSQSRVSTQNYCHTVDVFILTLSFLVTNPCRNNNGNCSHFCFLSAINASGYSCACPDSLVLDDNQRDCISKLLGLKLSSQLLKSPTHYAVPSYILIADHIYLRRMNLDGSGYTSILSYSYIHSLDFDYRYYCLITLYLLKTCFKTYTLGESISSGQTQATTE